MLKNNNDIKKIFSGSTLKIIALSTMFIDHTAAVLVSPYDFSVLYFVMRLLGRLAFPIFCFLLVEGMYYTSNQKNYLIRLGIFAIISEIPFDLAFHHTIYYSKSQNVFFTLFLGAFLIFIMKQKTVLSNQFAILLKIISIFIICNFAFFFKTDYGYKGILLILCYYLLRNTSYLKHVAASGIIFLLYGVTLEIGAIFAAIPMIFYNEKRGFNLKYLFYFFYPLHLMILFFLNITII